MVPDRIAADYERAAKRWAAVSWPLDNYRAHVGDEHPTHPIDLYLAGAAGHRVDAAWTVIEVELSDPTKRILTGLPKADYAIDDLWADARARLMENEPKGPQLPNGSPPARIIRYRGKVSLLNYFVVVARRLAIGRKRKIRPTLSLAATEDGPAPDPADTATVAPDAAAERGEVAMAMRNALAEAWGRLPTEQRFLLAMIYGQGTKQKEAGAMLKWLPFKTNRQVKAAKATLKEALLALRDVEWTSQLTAVWESCWSEHWKDVQDPPA